MDSVLGVKLTVGSPKTSIIFGVEGKVPQEFIIFNTTEYEPGCVNNIFVFAVVAEVGATN